ncbi:CoA-binding protein [Jeongeupia sp. HS-3]|uniref:CoA-binding protein n=1 Tax=Jeongeupia sp. HS-3 TaxID=1009682 RepID=UPI0018A651ED|nr:CoA-binding protein [Jeongeupia sp. HS-3]BCL76369.1 CoA-binding protein [Jeongeupia sp. HS-3]
MFRNPSDTEVRAFLAGVKRIAVLGLSPKPDRPSYRVSRYMQAAGFTIVPVRPGISEVLGETAYPALADVPGDIDLVDVFRRAEEVGAVVDAAIATGARGVWIQSGIINDDAATKARDAGLFVVMDRCLMVEHARLLG